MIAPPGSAKPASWRRALTVMLCAVLVWQLSWIGAAYVFTGGQEFADDTNLYRFYLEDPFITFSDRVDEVFGAAVAPPLLPLELKLVRSAFAPTGDFLAIRLAILLHMLLAYGVAYAVAFRYFGAPTRGRDWLQAALIAIVPIGWVTVLTAQDDSIAAAWSAACLAAWVTLGPIAAAITAGLGVFFGKVLLALGFLALWIATPGRRWPIAAVATAFMAAYLVVLFVRDGGFESYSEYVYPPIMGANPYAVISLLGIEYDLPATRNLSAVITSLALAGYTLAAVRRRLNLISASGGLYALFLATYFGTIAEYYSWSFPFLIVILWSSARRSQWGVFAAGWFISFFAYAYKVIYGLNGRFYTYKPGLKAWAAEHIPFNLDLLQAAAAVMTVACALALAVLVLLRDPTEQMRHSLRPRGVPSLDT